MVAACVLEELEEARTCAAHGYYLYYLNAPAGDRRSMAAADDPGLAWVREAWETMDKDPRVPLVTRV